MDEPKAPICYDEIEPDYNLEADSEPDPEPEIDYEDDDIPDILSEQLPGPVPSDPMPSDMEPGSSSSRDPLVHMESVESRGSGDLYVPEGPVKRSLTEATILTSTEYLSSDVESAPSGDLLLRPPPEFAPEVVETKHEVISEREPPPVKPKPHFTKHDTGTNKDTGHVNIRDRHRKGGLKVPGARLSAEEVRLRRKVAMEEEIKDNMADDPDFDESLNEMIRQQHMRRSMRKTRGKSRRLSKRSSGRSVSSEGSGAERPQGKGSIVDIYCGKEATTDKDELKENIKVQKDIISNIREQPWRMKRKLRTLRLAKAYVERYEGRLSKSRGYQEAGAKFWRKSKRVMRNFAAFFVPWEMRIKKIESHFGSVVSSYFTFLRWLLWVNILLAIITTGFIIIPEILAGKPAGSTPSKTVPEHEKEKALNLMTIIDFEGHLKYSVLFYGFYGNEEKIGRGYRLPLAYFLTGLSTYALSFIIILKRMAKNSRIGRMASKDEHYVFSWRLFASWDYMIGNFETAKNKAAENITNFRESIFEEQEKKKTENKKTLICLRLLANILVLIVLASSSYAIYLVVLRSQKFEKRLKQGEEVSWYERNEVSIVMSLITALYPTIFDLIGLMEKYHPRINLRWQLTRILILYLLNLYTLIIALHGKIQANQQLALSNSTCIYPTVMSPETTSHDRVFQETSVEDVSSHASHIFQTHTADLNISSHANVNSLQNHTGSDLVGTLFQNATGVNSTVFRNISDLATSIGGSTVEAFKSTVAETTSVVFTTEGVPKPEGTTVELYNCTTVQPGRPRELSCWETMIGQEIMKLTLFDTIIAVAVILVIDFIRGIWVRYCNGWWCWDLENKFPEYGEFKIAENILHLIYNQATIWMGTFFSPIMPSANIIKLLILLYVRSWAVLMCNIPHERVFKASKSNNFYFALLLLMLFLVTLPVMYLLVTVKPSVDCGPFSGFDTSYYIFTETIEKELPKWMNVALEYVASPGVILPLFLLMVMAIFYLASLSRSYKVANRDLMMQLHYERTEEKRKIYAMADARAKGNLKAAHNQAGESTPLLTTTQKPPTINEQPPSLQSSQVDLSDISFDPGLEVKQFQKGNVKVVRVPKLTMEQVAAIKLRSPRVKVITSSEARARGLMTEEDVDIPAPAEYSPMRQGIRATPHITPPVAIVQGTQSEDRGRNSASNVITAQINSKESLS